MKLVLVRELYREDGIFSRLQDDKGNVLFQCLERSYDNLPKVKKGVYTCKRGPHRLHGMKDSFDTFEIEGVKGHDNILFHWGNYNRDSEGCVLVGEKRVLSLPKVANSTLMVTNSKASFAKFMKMLEGLDTFQLEVA